MNSARPAATRLRKKSDASTKGERTRGRLLAACSAEFAKNGFVATRISDIVARAGVSQPVFYLYFFSKQAAYDELVTLFGQRLRDAIDRSLISGDVPMEEIDKRVRESIQTLLNILWDDSDLTRIGFIQSNAADMLKAELCILVARNLKVGQDADIFRPDISATLFAESFMGIMERFSRMRPASPQDEQTAAFLSTMLLEGIRLRCPNP